jgi:hypothetical protein
MGAERYHPRFASDLGDACAYYDSIANALGDRFRSNVRSAIRKIIDRPSSFGRIGGDFRGAAVERFPYVIVFAIDGGTLTFFGIRHAASNRDDWFARLT